VQAPRSINGLAVAGFVTSFLCGIIGLILSAIALSQINKSGQDGKGLAIAGIVIGAASMIIGVLWWWALVNSDDFIYYLF
jgi:ABC-type xylose transport system permease subunit